MRKAFFRSALVGALVFIASPVFADDQTAEISLWPNGVPGFESRKDEHGVRKQENNVDYTIHNVHSPTVTAFVPSKENATGAAVVIVPGGGHSSIWILNEGI